VFGAAFDNGGDIVASGWNPVGTVDFGGGVIPQGSFIVSYDATGKYLWQQGHAGSRLIAMGRKSNGNLVFTGILNTADNYGNGTLNPPAGNDVLLVELTPAGKYVNAIAVGSAGLQIGWRLAVDKNDNIVLGGMFDGTLNFGGNTLQGPGAGSGSFDLYIAKLDPSFKHVASIELKVNATNSNLFGLATDASGNVYAVGSFDATIDLGGGTLTSAGDRDIFIGKLDSNLGHVWSKQWGDDLYQIPLGVTVLSNGNFAVPGIYGGNLNFGCNALPFVAKGMQGTFVNVFDSQGGCVTTRVINGTNVYINGIATFADPEIAVGGNYYSSVSLPSGSLNFGNSQDGFVGTFQP
jgi:hypothetical protein